MMEKNTKLRRNWTKLLKCKKTKSLTQGGKKTLFPCKECTQVFTKDCDLTRHLDAHHREICHACPNCGKKFTRLYNAKAHLLHCTVNTTPNPVVTITPLKEAVRAGLIPAPVNNTGEPQFMKTITTGTEQPLITPHQRKIGAVGDDKKSSQFFQQIKGLHKGPNQPLQGTVRDQNTTTGLSYGLNTRWSPLMTPEGKIIPKYFSKIPAYLEEQLWLPRTSHPKNPDQDSELEEMTRELDIQITEDTTVPSTSAIGQSHILAEDLNLSSDSDEEMDPTASTGDTSRVTEELKQPPDNNTRDENIDSIINALENDISRIKIHKDALNPVLPHLQEIHNSLDKIITLATVRTTLFNSTE